MDVEGALSLLERAIRRDPDYFPPHFDYVELTDAAGRIGRRAQFYETVPGSKSLRECLRAVSQHRGSDGTLTVQRLERITADRSRGCARGALAVFEAAGESADGAATRTKLIEKLSDDHPESFALRAYYAARLLNAGDTSRSDSIYRELLGSRISLWVRLDILRRRARILRARGDTLGAQLLVAEITRMKRHTKAGVRASAAFALWGVWSERRSFDNALDSVLHFASLAGGTSSRRENFRAYQIFVQSAGWLNDLGDFRTALVLLDSAAAVANANDSPYFVLQAGLQRGRTLRSLGRARDAIGDLEGAIRAGREVDARYLTADAFHQLAHSYEALADWPRAVAAADSFVARGHELNDRGMTMIRLYDAGVIRWKAGWHAAADDLFRRMVTTIDSLDYYHSYAGRFYEQRGDAARALHYYRRAVEKEIDERKLGLAGMTRMYELTGQLDSALAAARRHDALAHHSSDVLVPRMLARVGRTQEAVAIARRWAAIQSDRGNVAAAARALTELAEMRPHIPPHEARALANAGARHAQRVSAVRELIAARRTAATITAELGNVSAGLQELGSLRDFLRTRPDQLEEMATLTAMANVHLRGRDWRAAVASFDSAAKRLDDLEKKAAGDEVLAARLRSARLDLFDGAYEAALLAPTNVRIPVLLAWSNRKKSLNQAVDAIARSAPALPADVAIADFINVRDTLWAVVTTSGDQSLLRLPMTGSAAARLSGELLRPFRSVAAGQVDLSRAQFDAERARMLYDGLLRPIEARAARATQLVLVLDAPLQSVPFDALMRLGTTTNVNHTTGIFAADKWSFTFATTYSAARRSAVAARRVHGSMLLVTADAPGVQREKSAIKRAWQPVKESAPYATRESVTSGMSGHAILHFATHAVSNDRDPLASHLRLRTGSGPDGLLHANEIPELADNPMVVLSACETASGEILHGAGVLSLARAFLTRGASATVATQWPIGETAAQLSEHFYATLARGASPSAALYAAKRRIRSNPATSHPFYWASHVLLVR